MLQILKWHKLGPNPSRVVLSLRCSQTKKFPSTGLYIKMLSTDKRTRPFGPTLVKNHKAINSIHMNNFPKQEQHQHIWIITGPAGCGKTTVAQYLAAELALPYIEGDDYHSTANKEKMGNGIPLTDADRWDWLIMLREEAVKRLEHSDGAIVTCSALRHRYRDVIRGANYFHPSIHIHFIYLSASEELLLERVGARKGHYMNSNMVHSQMLSLEPPDSEETNIDVIPVDCSASETQVKKMALVAVEQKLAEYD